MPRAYFLFKYSAAFVKATYYSINQKGNIMKSNHSETQNSDRKQTLFESLTHPSASKKSTELNNFLEDLEDLIAQTTSLTGDELVNAKEKISSKIMEAKKSIEQIGDSLTSQARKSAAITDNYVHEQPWTAIAASATVGLLIGLLVSRRN
jgi:ElaB/YqjD/DUF883 family membrane-anchored ribosome-binding protein